MSFSYGLIKDISSWFKYAPPKKGVSQFKCKKSALELARYITQDINNMPDEIARAIEYCGEDISKCFEWTAEFVTNFKTSGGGRNHDLAIFGDHIFVGTEAKVEESYDKLISDWIKVESNSNRLNRLNDFCNDIFYNNYIDIKDDVDKLRYQLLSGLDGTIVEAKKQEKLTGVKKKALFLIITFKPGIYTTKMGKNDNDFKSFISLLEKKRGFVEKSDREDYKAYHLKCNCNDVDTYIVKVIKNIGKECPCSTCSFRSECNDKRKK